MEQGEQISVMMETNELDPNSFHNEMFHNIKEIFEKKLFCDVTLFGKDETSEKTGDDVKGNHVLKGFMSNSFHIQILQSIRTGNIDEAFLSFGNVCRGDGLVMPDMGRNIEAKRTSENSFFFNDQ